MFSSMRDLPFFDAIFPVLAALAVWIGMHMFYIGPEIIGPRLAQKYYLPACQANITRTIANVAAAKQARSTAHQTQVQQSQRQMNNLLGGFMRGVFGDEFVDYYGDDPLVKSMQDMVDVGMALENPIDNLPGFQAEVLATADYCQCIISENIGERVSTGLFSASLRIWKPANIRRLENLGNNLIDSSICHAPTFN